MSLFVLENAREKFGNQSVALDWDTNAFRADLLRLDGTLTDTAVKAITNVTNVNPAVYTSTSHGFSNGDIVVVRGVGGALGANQIGKVANVAANTFELQALSPEAVSVQTPGVYTSGGCAINLTKIANRQDYDAASVHGANAPGASGGPAVPASKTSTKGVFQCTSPLSWTAVPDLSGGQVHGYVLAKDSGSAATDAGVFFYDGRHEVRCSKTAAASATSIDVEPLIGGIASGAVIYFSNGVAATLTGAAAKGARTLSVSAIASGIGAGHTAQAPFNVTDNFPKTTNGSNMTLDVDATEGLFTL